MLDVSSYVSNLQKAKLWIIDPETQDLSLNAMNAGGAGIGSMDTSGLDNLASQMESAANSIANAVTGGGQVKPPTPLDGKKYNRYFEVQFNPSSMQLSGRKLSEHGSFVQNNFLHNGSGIEKSYYEPTIYLSMDLHFNQVVPNRSFVSDALMPTVGNIASAIKEAVSEPKTPVQDMVEAITAALRRDRKRVCFCWGQMAYEGELRSWRARYTHFDMAGRPVAAKGTLEIYLRDYSVTSTSAGYWSDAYYKAFPESGGKLI